MGRPRSAESIMRGTGSRPANGYRGLPSVDTVISHPLLEAAILRYSRSAVTEAVREELQRARVRIAAGEPPLSQNDVIAGATAALSQNLEPSILPVVNATGVIIHTNLGRAPLSEEALQASQEVAVGYTNLEMDLATGGRGSRHVHLDELLRRLTGAEAGVAVNNNAAAVMLVLRALAQSKEVVVSRGEAVEIGGGFRIPDVMAQSDATLVEVGTTNRTYLKDYENAVTAETGAFLKVHRSNFKISGFTHESTVAELAKAASLHSIPLLYDLGSGCLLDTAKYGLPHEPTPREALSEGADLVMFSGDKLLGGPQAGIVVGKSRYINLIKEHPLVRAMRIDKVTLAALQVTLLHYLRDEATDKLPVWRMISASRSEIQRRAKRLVKAAGGKAMLSDSKSTIGGGTLPDEELPTVVMSIPAAGRDLDEMATILRAGTPPVVARIERDKLVFDPRTILPEQDKTVEEALKRLLA